MSSTPSQQSPSGHANGQPPPAPPQAEVSRPLSPRSWFVALLLQRCPRCREGRLFKSMFRMNDPCPVCGALHEREPGYFIGAMYFSYALAILIMVPLFFVFHALLPHWPLLLLPLLPGLIYLPLTPLVYRYSRVLWIYFDRLGGVTERATLSGTRPRPTDLGEPRAPNSNSEPPASPDPSSGAEKSWAVHRQDDNGNHFLVQTGLTREEAERLVAVFEARGHKQVYWAEPAQGNG